MATKKKSPKAGFSVVTLPAVAGADVEVLSCDADRVIVAGGGRVAYVVDGAVRAFVDDARAPSRPLRLDDGRWATVLHWSELCIFADDGSVIRAPIAPPGELFVPVAVVDDAIFCAGQLSHPFAFVVGTDGRVREVFDRRGQSASIVCDDDAAYFVDAADDAIGVWRCDGRTLTSMGAHRGVENAKTSAHHVPWTSPQARAGHVAIASGGEVVASFGPDGAADAGGRLMPCRRFAMIALGDDGLLVDDEWRGFDGVARWQQSGLPVNPRMVGRHLVAHGLAPFPGDPNDRDRVRLIDPKDGAVVVDTQLGLTKDASITDLVAVDVPGPGVIVRSTKYLKPPQHVHLLRAQQETLLLEHERPRSIVRWGSSLATVSGLAGADGTVEVRVWRV